MKISSNADMNIANSNSRIGFAKTGGGSWEVWDRFITLDGEKLFHIGNICGTCNFFFRKQAEANASNIKGDLIIEKLNSGNDISHTTRHEELNNKNRLE